MRQRRLCYDYNIMAFTEASRHCHYFAMGRTRQKVSLRAYFRRRDLRLERPIAMADRLRSLMLIDITFAYRHTPL